jgi:flagellar biosynthetic protein FliQ
MEPVVILQLGREVLLLALLLSLPAVAASLLVGLVVSVLQVVTSIQEQTLSFVPRIIAVAAILWLTFPWMLQVLSTFSLRLFTRVMEIGL